MFDFFHRKLYHPLQLLQSTIASVSTSSYIEWKENELQPEEWGWKRVKKD